VLNLVACLILMGFNLALGIWPMVAMNAVLSAINVWFIAKLQRERHDEAAFAVLAVGTDDAYLRHMLAGHSEDIQRFQPDFVLAADQSVFLVQKGDETVGVVAVHARDGVAYVDLDYVTPRFRDFSPGEFVWRQSELLRDLGVRQVKTSAAMVGAYYDRLGFQRTEDFYVLDVP